MASSRSRRRDDGKGEDFGSAIFSRLVEELKQRTAEEEFKSDVVAFFCGSKRSGKTSIVDRFINPTKEDSDQPKPTVALDYKFARYASETTSSKVLAHIYDLGGDESNDNLIGIPISPATVGNLVLSVVLDLSEPHAVLPALERWLALLRAQVMKSLDALAKESPAGALRVETLMKTKGEAYAEHEDHSKVDPFPVPLLIFGAKWDFLANDVDPEKRRMLCRSLRYFAHVNGATLIFTSVKEKASMNAARAILRQSLFGVASKGAIAEQLDPLKPLIVTPGKDSLQSIGEPAAGAQELVFTVAQQFPDPQPNKKGGKRSEAEQVSDELAKFPESTIDGMVEQRIEELHQYRKQVERSQRLATEGVDISKSGIGAFGN